MSQQPMAMTQFQTMTLNAKRNDAARLKKNLNQIKNNIIRNTESPDGIVADFLQQLGYELIKTAGELKTVEYEIILLEGISNLSQVEE